MALPALRFAVIVALAGQGTQVGQTLRDPNPSDARMNQFEDAKGASWRVFAVDSYPNGPLGVIEVQEVRQHNPPSTWAVSVRNRSLGPIGAYTMAAAIVSGDGHIKGIQTLPRIKNLEPGKVSRQEMRVRVTVLAPTDRVVFYVNEVSGEMTPEWKVESADLTALVKAAAKRMPVP